VWVKEGGAVQLPILCDKKKDKAINDSQKLIMKGRQGELSRAQLLSQHPVLWIANESPAQDLQGLFDPTTQSFKRSGPLLLRDSCPLFQPTRVRAISFLGQESSRVAE
jgi:hypothetical protein